LGNNLEGWSSILESDENYSPSLRLPAGASLRLDWKAEPHGYATGDGRVPQHSCLMKDIVSDDVLGPIAEHYGPRNWSNGRFLYAPDFSQPAAVADVRLEGARAQGGALVAAGGQRGRAIFPLSLPYSYVSARVNTSFANGDGRLAVSTDRGRSWSETSNGDISALVKQKYDVWVRADFSGTLENLRVDALVEHNRGALPYLMNGKNRITVSLDQNKIPAGNKLIIVYSYQEAVRPAAAAGRARWDGRELNYGPVKIVRKEITSVPFSFEIKVGGNTPPKMLSLERIVRPV
jgi:hypothetical protein